MMLAALVVATLVAQSPARDARPPATAASSIIRGRVLTIAGQPDPALLDVLSSKAARVYATEGQKIAASPVVVVR